MLMAGDVVSLVECWYRSCAKPSFQRAISVGFYGLQRFKRHDGDHGLLVFGFAFYRSSLASLRCAVHA